MLDYSSFVSVVHDLATFMKPLKILRFAGLGEPLLHKQLTKMVAYAKEYKVAEQIEILSNGTLFDGMREIQLALAGVTRFIISVQGTTLRRYREVCGKPFDPEIIADRLRHLKDRSSSTEIYVKIVDTALTSVSDGSRFYNLFGPSCHKISIEHTVPIHPAVDYDSQIDEHNRGLTQFGSRTKKVRICPRPFMSLHVIPDGNVIPCYSLEYPVILGNVKETSLRGIWSGELLRSFRRQMIEHGRACNDICANCKIIEHRVFPEENLDGSVELLQEKMRGI
jgi:radical SAM protein with 4Fe4S-binding SPASM domain